MEEGVRGKMEVNEEWKRWEDKRKYWKKRRTYENIAETDKNNDAEEVEDIRSESSQGKRLRARVLCETGEGNPVQERKRVRDIRNTREVRKRTMDNSAKEGVKGKVPRKRRRILTDSTSSEEAEETSHESRNESGEENKTGPESTTLDIIRNEWKDKMENMRRQHQANNERRKQQEREAQGHN